MITELDKGYLVHMISRVILDAQAEILEVRLSPYFFGEYREQIISKQEDIIKCQEELIERINSTHIGTNSKRKSPFKDYKGRDIYEGDTIIHPSGKEGIVLYENKSNDYNDNWLVRYESVISSPKLNRASRLCLQVGEKGQAISKGKTNDYKQQSSKFHTSNRIR